MAAIDNSCFLLINPLKLLNQTNLNLVGSIYGRPSIKIARFVLKSTKDGGEGSMELPTHVAHYISGHILRIISLQLHREDIPIHRLLFEPW